MVETIVLKPGKEQSLLRYHPWIFSGAIGKLPAGIREGDPVRVTAADGRFLGLGHFQVGSIAVRIFSFTGCNPDAAFWREKIGKALAVREAAGLTSGTGTTVFRLVNGEGDGFPGLVVDFYAGVAVMQMHTAGMFRIRETLADALRDVLGGRLHAIYDKSEKTLPYKAPVTPADGYLGQPAAVPRIVAETGLLFSVDWETGQKTGFFIDQRENRRLVEQYSQGRRVLNLFSYTGGFSAYALRGGAERVDSVDSSARAADLAAGNILLNFPGEERHRQVVADAFDFLKESREPYDLIILDPPAFAKHQGALPNALKAYRRLNEKAFRQILSGGILFTFSCSQTVPRERFREAVFSAAALSGRNVRILHQLTQPADHPVSLYHPEGEYLKGLVLLVE